MEPGAPALGRHGSQVQKELGRGPEGDFLLTISLPSRPCWEGSSYPESILADGSAEKTNGVQMHQQTSFRFLLELLHAANI